ncbi:MAG: XRE family transcriptional regulator [Rhodocyclales bacterium]|nr:XRE family transcriptional regulator [Rhodocyclales bacterium]
MNTSDAMPAAVATPPELPLNKLRRARGLSQKTLAGRMNVQQPIVAKQEQQVNMYISTLRSHIEAMGGKLEIFARFPEGNVKISSF